MKNDARFALARSNCPIQSSRDGPGSDLIRAGSPTACICIR